MELFIRNGPLKTLSAIALILVFTQRMSAADPRDVTIIDTMHYSNVFGETRNYRIFFPRGYYDNAEKKYPVFSG